jgi:acetylornithine/N-succinyldiaminopimelate aminotransferase
MPAMSAILPVYRRSNITISRGDGVYLFAPDSGEGKGKQYLDFAAGIAVNSLGHSHPHIVAALKKQADILWHCSNMYQMPQLNEFAERLVAASFADKVFFCNSGGEAVECGLKILRKYQDYIKKPEKYRVITMAGGFHGRSFACISAGGNEVARAGYAPLLDGFDRVKFNDLGAVVRAITPETAAILLEPIQGEGGIHEATSEFLQGLQTLANEHGLLLFIDEVQCGMGRTGSLFAYQQAGITPDIVSVAKGIGNGFPLGACLTTNKVAACMSVGAHGSTYGSNPLAMAVGNAVLDLLLAPDFLASVVQIGELLKAELIKIVGEFANIFSELRGRGLILGIQVKSAYNNVEIVEKLRIGGLLTSPAEGNVIRITPPLIIQEKHVVEAVSIIRKTLKEFVI